MHVLVILLLAAPLQIIPHPAGVTTLVSVSSDDVQGDNISVNSSVSDDGRFVAFESLASDLVSGDTNQHNDVFLRDRVLGTTVRMSVTSAGDQVAKGGMRAAISGDGTQLGFMSEGQVFVAGDVNLTFDVFVRDLQTGSIALASADPSGLAGNEQSGPAALSHDGRFVAFTSRASNLVPGDLNHVADIFVRDMLLGVTERVSVATDGSEADGGSLGADITPDGRYVVFTSFATDLVPDDGNLQGDIFLRDRLLGTTELVSRAPDGTPGTEDSSFPSVSGDGHYVAFHSRASNFTAGDSNGVTDVFVKDRLTGEVELISAGLAGALVTEASDSPDLSADGRFVAFGSQADNLVPPAPSGADHHEDHEVFLRDRLLGTTQQVSLTPAGQQADLGSINPHMTPDAAVIAFETYATNLVAQVTDTNNSTDVVVHDMTPWTDLQGGLVGVQGVPQLTGQGLLVALLPAHLALSAGAPTAPALLVVTLQSQPVAFKGGTLVAFPSTTHLPLVTDGTGAWALDVIWPEGVPAGVTLWFQVLLQDPAAIHGVAMSNALAAVTP